MWTEELQQQTRELFETLPMLAMKNFGDSRYIITDRESNAKWVYESIDALISDGWAID